MAKATLLLPLSLAIVTCALSGATAGAENSLEPEVSLIAGNRVRLYSTMYSRPVTGRVQAIDADHVVLAVDDAMVINVPANSLARVQVSTARKRRTLRGALIGVAVGIPMGLTADVGGYCGPGSTAFCNRTDAMVGSILGSAAVGAAIGRLVRTDEWADVRLPPVAVGLTPGGGVRLAVGGSF